MGNVFLHVGYPKTRTTSLQTGLFQEHNQIVDVRSNVSGMDKIHKQICKKLSFRSGLAVERIEKIREREDTARIYSDERFTANLENTAPASITRSTVAHRLYNVFS
jgi:hypothetical protein